MSAPFAFSTDKAPLAESTPPFVFSSDKGISSVRITNDWNAKMDVDVTLIGLDKDGKYSYPDMFPYLLAYMWNEMVKLGTIPAAVRDEFIKVYPDGSYGSIDESMVHSQDIRDGSLQAADEWVLLKLLQIPLKVVRIPVLLSTFAQSGPPPAFGQVEGAIFRMTNEDTGNVIQEYDLTKDFRDARVIHAGDWRRVDPKSRVFEFKPKGEASPSATLKDVLIGFGVPF